MLELKEKPVMFGVERVGPRGIGVVTLNRPAALNALNTECYDLLEAKLLEWARDDEVAAVLLTGAGDKAFCAGGDVKGLVLDGQKRGPDVAREFFTQEYFVDYMIHSYSKPVIALMDGITMGGGLGLAVGASFRVVTERTMVAMPELAIGLFPDVGATRFLHSAPEPLGLFMGLTGARVTGSDAIALGLADYFLHSSFKRRFLVDILRLPWAVSPEENRKVAADFFNQALKDKPQATNAEAFKKVTKVLKKPSSLDAVDQDLRKLDAPGFLLESITRYRAGSPLSRAVFFEAYRRHQKLTIGEALTREWDMAVRFSREPEFHEGVRAVLIDKDQKPKWHFQSHKDVKDIDDYFSAGEPNLLAAKLKKFRF